MTELTINNESISKYFDGWYNGTYTVNRKGSELYRLMDVLNEIPINVKSVLDYGCGQGSWVHLLSDRFPDSEITGVDISKNGIEIASELFPNHEFYWFNGETAPFPDHSFDLIFSWHVLDVVSNLDGTLLDISRLLKKGGFLCIVVPCGNEGSLEEKITRLIRGGGEITIDGEMRFFYSYAQHRRRMKSDELIELLANYDLIRHKEFHSGQFWAAIEWISSTGLSFINDLFNYKRGVNTSAKMKLLLLKMIFVPLSIVVRLSSVNLTKKIKDSRNTARRILLVSLIPFKVISMLFAKMLFLFAFLEWHLRKTNKNGSVQYLIMKKQEGE